VYLPGTGDGLACESKILSMGTYGDDTDFFTLKGHIEALLGAVRAEGVSFEPCSDNPSYHPGRCATVWSGDECIGVFGQIHPLVAQNYGVDAELYCAELSFDKLFAAKGSDPEYTPLPKFPAVTRDIAVVCEEKVTVGALEKVIAKASKGLLRDVKLFDIYRGKGVDEGKKSVAFNLTFRAEDRSLTGEEADKAVAAVLKALYDELGAVLRA
ncbi:MAG: phenylalanine--tRNA ligase subunit beta, partial [Clostridia bacterium]|nr:phenylalanine--tRNA ligase subunit beta [Clostridia bacterium]